MALVLKTMEDAIGELDNMGSLVSSYKIHLNVRIYVSVPVQHRLNSRLKAAGDDISYIQSQNRGLQVQTQNQRALLAEVDNLLVSVCQDSLKSTHVIYITSEYFAD